MEVLRQLVIASDSVWTPNLVLVNNVNKLEKIGDDWQLIRALPNGETFYYPGDVFSASCRVDVTFYPWDRHKCSFSFAPWGQVNTELVLGPTDDKVLTSYFSENGAWAFYHSGVETSYGGHSIDFVLYLKRKPMYVFVNVILPIIFMAFLNTMIFAIPVESGERISYSITVLLAIAVFLTLVGDNLPKTSSPMSFFGYYLLAVLIISIGITIVTILNVHLYYKDENDPVPEWIAGFTKLLQCKCRNKTHKRKHSTTKSKTGTKRAKPYANHIANVENYTNNIGVITESYYQIHRGTVYRPMINGRLPFQRRSMTNTVESNNSVEEQKYEGTQNDKTMSWKDVSSALDNFFFLVSFVVIAVATVSFFAYISGTNKDNKE
ncbi:acetylcholine receptor subunit alpha-like [Ruditapes philippinarum]|uniref:acetylcholine receptor subunit alpha-like n=1 Tax=Ruditapes philippinarum TaxID=129788 RepID=UPI00295A65C3|nr:acetylcholine receptor subunit alpha-like [Ruditapes philippinarum]